MSGVEPQIRVGQIVATHGVKGGVKVRLLTDFLDRFDVGQVVYLKGEPRKIVRSNTHKDQVRIQIEGLNSISEAELLKWEYLTVPEGAKPKLAKDEFLSSELVGMAVVTMDGKDLGPLDEVIASPAQDLFRVGEVLIPVVKQFVKKIDTANRTITVELIPGMLPGEDAEE